MKKEIEQTRAQKLGVKPYVFKVPSLGRIGYCQGIENADQPGDFCVILLMHGAGERGNDNDRQLVWGADPILHYVRTHKIKTVFLAPQCPDEEMWIEAKWDLPEHKMTQKPTVRLDLAYRLLQAKIKEFHADKSRIYITGISMGGFGTWDMISRHPKTFAAAVPVCGGADVRQAKKLVDLPIMVFHGDQDGAVMVKRARDMVAAIKAAGGTKILYHEFYEQNHDVWIPAYRDSMTLDWLFAQKKG